MRPPHNYINIISKVYHAIYEEIETLLNFTVAGRVDFDRGSFYPAHDIREKEIFAVKLGSGHQDVWLISSTDYDIRSSRPIGMYELDKRDWPLLYDHVYSQFHDLNEKDTTFRSIRKNKKK